MSITNSVDPCHPFHACNAASFDPKDEP